MELPILGIDISKDTADLCFLRDGKPVHKIIENSVAGFRKLKEWLNKLNCQRAQCCMEATGRYWEALALFLHEDGHVVSVVNPSTVAAYRRSELSRSKTDKADAGLIARYCLSVHPKPWAPPSPEQYKLQQLVRHLGSLKNMRQQERHRLSSGLTDDDVASTIKDHIQFLTLQINQLKKVIRAHIRSVPQLKRAWALLDSIIGVGESLSFTFLAEVGLIDRFSDIRKLTAFVGLDVHEFRSGTSVFKRPKISKAGNVDLRKALYMPALSAMRYNPVIIAFVGRLRERRVHGMAIVCAVMRKLLHTMYGVLKTQTVFNPEVQFRGRRTSLEEISPLAAPATLP